MRKKQVKNGFPDFRNERVVGSNPISGSKVNKRFPEVGRPLFYSLFSIPIFCIIYKTGTRCGIFIMKGGIEIMPFNLNSITKEMFEKAMQCKSADELIALAKAGGVELTKEEAEAYMAELADVELNEETLKKVAGGVCWDNCPSEGSCGHHVCGTVGWENFKGC